MSPAASAGLRERGKSRRIDRILEATRELLREDPEASPTVDQIADRAEVSKGTVFNLVGTRESIWAELSSRALGRMEFIDEIDVEDPQEQARLIVDGIMKALCDDAPVFKALLNRWDQSGQVLQRDPADEILRCLEAATEEGTVAPNLRLRRLAELTAAGLNGIVHQWAAGLLSDRSLRARAKDLVDLAFGAARPDGIDGIRWQLANR